MNTENIIKLLREWYAFNAVHPSDEDLAAMAVVRTDEAGRVSDPLEPMRTGLTDMSEDFGTIILDDFVSYVQRRHSGAEESEFMAWARDEIFGYTDPFQNGRAYQKGFGFGDMGQSESFMSRLMMDQNRRDQ